MSHNYPKNKLFFIFLTSGLLGFLVSYYHHYVSVDDKPLHVTASQPYHYPISFVAQIEKAPDAGEKIYKEYCAACHNVEPLIDVKAPRVGDVAKWKALKKLNLLQITLQGKGAMPARGGCFECSDAQLKAAIDYMLRISK